MVDAAQGAQNLVDIASEYSSFVAQMCNPKDNDLVQQDRRLTTTMKSEGYSYAAADDDNEEWLASEDC